MKPSEMKDLFMRIFHKKKDSRSKDQKKKERFYFDLNEN